MELHGLPPRWGVVTHPRPARTQSQPLFCLMPPGMPWGRAGRWRGRARLAAARDVDDGAGHVRGLVGGEPKHRARDLLGLAGTCEWRGGADPLEPARIAARDVDLGA